MSQCHIDYSQKRVFVAEKCDICSIFSKFKSLRLLLVSKTDETVT